MSTNATSTNMNVMGQLFDKAKRAIVMRTIPNEKSSSSSTEAAATAPSSTLPTASPMQSAAPTSTAKPMLPIRIQELEAKIENRPTIIDEKSPAVLKYRTPHFR